MNCTEYVNLKTLKIRDWLISNNKSTIVLGISGGVDSAITLGLLRETQERFPDVLHAVIAVIAPIHNSIGTTEQEEATELALTVCRHFKAMYKIVPGLGKISNAYTNSINFKEAAYDTQQIDYWLRPTAFYGIAMQYKDAVLCSTINKSEWLCGYFSKYLDVLDIRPIIDLYKSEVYILAKHFNIPSVIIDTPPKGGLASGKTDEEQLGFTYQNLEDFYEYSACFSTFDASLIAQTIAASQFKRSTYRLNFIYALNILSGEDDDRLKSE